MAAFGQVFGAGSSGLLTGSGLTSSGIRSKSSTVAWPVACAVLKRLAVGGLWSKRVLCTA